MSTHSVPVVRIESIEAHPDADALDVVRVNGYQCVVKRGEFHPGDLAIYIEPDYMVPLDNPLFSWLRPANKPDRTMQRIGVKRLRGVYSMGLLLPALPGMTEGDDVMAELGIERYEPPEDASVGTGGETEEPPYRIPIPVYDLENLRHYPNKLAGRDVIITEKIHGTNARYVWSSEHGRMFCGSRREWKRDGDNAYWRALRAHPWIEAWCKAYPDIILWGEVYGWVQDLRYGANPGELFFKAFDAYQVQTGRFWPHGSLITSAGYPVDRLVPLVFEGACPPLAVLEAMADGDSLIGPHMREGIVIEEVVPNGWDDDLKDWRVKLKLPGNRYLARGDK